MTLLKDESAWPKIVAGIILTKQELSLLIFCCSLMPNLHMDQDTALAVINYPYRHLQLHKAPTCTLRREMAASGWNHNTALKAGTFPEKAALLQPNVKPSKRQSKNSSLSCQQSQITTAKPSVSLVHWQFHTAAWGLKHKTRRTSGIFSISVVMVIYYFSDSAQEIMARSPSILVDNMKEVIKN